MEELKEIYRNRIKATPQKFTREAMNKVHWEARLVGIRGARGVGKTTLMLQHLKQLKIDLSDSLFTSLDNLYFTEHDLYHLAHDFVNHGGKYLYLDEVHKYKNWSQEIKNIYDDFPELHIAFTGSSLLSLKDGNADLSRRAVMYEMPGLSFREYIKLVHGISLPIVSLDDIIKHSDDISDEVTSKLKPLQVFSEYLQYGYYPFVTEGKDFYFQRLIEVANYIIEAEMPQLRRVETSMIPKIKQLLYIISQSAPFIPNITKLSERTGISRNAMLNYLQVLHESKLTTNTTKPNQGLSLLQKPDKIYIENTNLMYAMTGKQTNIGNVRETFFLNQLHNSGATINISPISDFIVNNSFTFEIGGPNKDSHQIKDIPYSYIAMDNIEYGTSKKLPLWQFGLMY